MVNNKLCVVRWGVNCDSTKGIRLTVPVGQTFEAVWDLLKFSRVSPSS